MGLAPREELWPLCRDHRYRTVRRAGPRRDASSPYREAKRVFWIVDHGSSHRGAAACRRLQAEFADFVLVHLPVHASWLNQIEIYFSIVQRKALTPNDFPCLEAVAERLANFERYFESIAQPFEWKFTRADLNALIARMRNRWAQNQLLKLAA